jgi:predicted MarR family transcription regulator
MDDRSPHRPHRWHLADSPLEQRLTELEYALMRANESFLRWQAECLAASAPVEASGPENALLHVIRMNDRPKSVKELARLTNREDIPNIQYGLRKLKKAGLIEAEGASRTGIVYRVTEEGRRVTDRYAEVRRALLVDLLGRLEAAESGLGDAAQTLDLVCGLYDQAALAAATRRTD